MQELGSIIVGKKTGESRFKTAIKKIFSALGLHFAESTDENKLADKTALDAVFEDVFYLYDSIKFGEEGHGYGEAVISRDEVYNIQAIPDWLNVPRSERKTIPEEDDMFSFLYQRDLNQTDKVMQTKQKKKELNLTKEELLKQSSISSEEKTNQNTETVSNNTFQNLPNKTEQNNIVIKEVFNQEGIEYAKSIGGIFTLRVNNSNKHFGNPFTGSGKTGEGIVKSFPTIKEAVQAYKDWLTTNKYDKEFPQLLERKNWINSKIRSGELKNKPLVYYKELGELAHANILDELINSSTIENKTEENQVTEEQLRKMSLSELLDKYPEALGIPKEFILKVNEQEQENIKNNIIKIILY